MSDLAIYANNAFSAVIQAEDKFEKIAHAHGKLIFSIEAEYARQAIEKSVSENKANGLFKCTPESIYNAVAQVSAIGLSLNPKLQYAYLVPRKNTTTGFMECSLDLGYRGLIQLGVDSGAITHCTTDSMYQWDIEEGRIIWNGPSQEPTYNGLNPFDTRRDTIDSLGVFCTAHLSSGGVIVTRMSRKELDQARSLNPYSKAYKDWKEQMDFKNVIKRSSKTWPMKTQDDRLQSAVDFLNKQEVIEKEISEAKPADQGKPVKLASNNVKNMNSILQGLTA